MEFSLAALVVSRAARLLQCQLKRLATTARNPSTCYATRLDVRRLVRPRDLAVRFVRSSAVRIGAPRTLAAIELANPSPKESRAR